MVVVCWLLVVGGLAVVVVSIFVAVVNALSTHCPTALATLAAANPAEAWQKLPRNGSLQVKFGEQPGVPGAESMKTP